jgi:disulfide bond formation protein DsbB
MSNFKIEFYLKLVLLISLLAIISAYYIEYILGHQPCNLCVIERIPYLLSLIILLINFKFKKIEKILILSLIFIFVFSLIVSIYHFGIEQGFFQESLICDLKNEGNILSKEELLIELQKKTVSCKDVTFRIFGFSLTTFNIIISILLIILLTKIFISYEKIRH